jgi:hypothetical protein
VGIKTTTPDRPLVLNNTSNSYMGYRIANTEKWATGCDTAGYYIYGGTSPDYQFAILNNAYIGFGTVTPTEKCHVIGNILASGIMIAQSIKLTTSAVNGYFWKCTNVNGSGAWSAITTSLSYKGTWNANTNTPTLANGSGTAGDFWRCVVAGTTNFGAGNITFVVGDDTTYNGSIWSKIPGQGYALQSATASVLGGVMISTGLNVDGSGNLSVAYGTSGSTACVGNDSRLVSHSDVLVDGDIGSTILAYRTFGTAANYDYEDFDPAGSVTTHESAYDHTSWLVNNNDDTTSGSLTAANFALGSDERLKTNICSIPVNPININYKQFELKSKPSEIRYGVIAQELQREYPELVGVGKNGILNVNYFDLLIREVAYLKNKVAELEGRIK